MSEKRSFRRLARDGDYRLLVERIPYARFLGIDIQSSDEGRVYRMPFGDELLGNPVRGSLHGGVIAGLCENAALIEVLIGEEQNRIPKPIDFSIDYLRRGRSVDTYAWADIVRQGRRIVLVRVDCWQQSRDRLIAQSRIHLLLEPVL